MIKLKKILKESSPGFENRKFGDALPTLDSVKASYDSKNGTLQEDNLNEAPMDKRFAKDWEKSCNALINHLKSEQKGKLGAHKGTVAKMIDMLRTVKGYPDLMGSLFGEE